MYCDKTLHFIPIIFYVFALFYSISREFSYFQNRIIISYWIMNILYLVFVLI